MPNIFDMRMIFLLSVVIPSLIQAQNVGIGTTTPTGKLEIHHRSSTVPGIKLIDSATNSGGVIEFRNMSNSTSMKMSMFSSNNFHNGQFLDIRSDSAAGITIKGNGFVGIRDLNPAYALEVQGDINTIGLLRINGNPGTPGQVLTSNGTLNPVWQEANPKIGCSVGMTGNYSAPAGASFLPFDNETPIGYFDDGNVFDNINHFFTAPAAGVYIISASIYIVSPPPGNYFFNLPITTELLNSWGFDRQNVIAGTVGIVLKVNSIRKMAAGSRVYLHLITPASCIVQNNAGTTFSATRLY